MSLFVGLVICMGIIMLGFTVYLMYCWVKEDKYAKWFILIMIGWLIFSCYLFWVLDQWWVIFVWVLGYAYIVFGGKKVEDEKENLENDERRY